MTRLAGSEEYSVPSWSASKGLNGASGEVQVTWMLKEKERVSCCPDVNNNDNIATRYGCNK